MAILMPDRTRQIAGEILATSNPQSITLYTPSTASVLGTTVNYNGGMARIRVCAIIDSLPETYAPIILPTDTNAQKEQKNQFFRAGPKKGLIVYLENPAGNKRYKVGIIDIYNVKPCFLSGISEFFSDLEIYGIQFGWKIVAQVIDRGYGLLEINSGEGQQNDEISFTGFAKEESSFLQGDNDAIYNFVV
jgi:hypothetical protein